MERLTPDKIEVLLRIRNQIKDAWRPDQTVCYGVACGHCPLCYLPCDGGRKDTCEREIRMHWTEIFATEEFNL